MLLFWHDLNKTFSFEIKQLFTIQNKVCKGELFQNYEGNVTIRELYIDISQLYTLKNIDMRV